MVLKWFNNAQARFLPLFWGFCLFWTISPFPFPFGNQDPYLFWAINASLDGKLNADFLSNQPDPFPLFTLLYRFLPVQFFAGLSHFLMFLICVVYAKSASELLKKQWKEYPVFILAILLVIHSSFLWGGFFKHLFFADYRWFTHHGIAKQGLLFGYFQPSALGVFLLLGLVYYFQSKYREFLLCLLVAGAFHANYILLGLILGCLAFLFRPRELWKEKKIMILLILVWVSYLWYSINYFKVEGSAFNEAAVYFIQHNPHLDPLNWLNLETLIKLGFIWIAFYRRRHLFEGKFLLSLLGVTVFLSILTLVSKNSYLINLAPWRMSVIMMPMAIFFTIQVAIEKIKDRSWLKDFPFFGLILGAVVAELIYCFLGNPSSEYLIKWRWVAFFCLFLGALVNGIFSRFNDNKDLPALLALLILPLAGMVQYGFEKRECSLLPESSVEQELGQICGPNALVLFPLPMKSIRLRSLCPVYIDANVYFTPALPEWKRRLLWNKEFFQNPTRFSKEEIRKEGITHLVCSPEISLKEGSWMKKKKYKNLNVYQLNEP